MAYKLSNETIKDFNEKYGVDISVSKYLDEAKRTSPNDALVTMFAAAYRRAIIADLSSGKDPQSQRMLEDFKTNVIDSLIWELPMNKQPAPDKNAGLTKLEQYNLMEQTLNSLPASDTDVVAERYMNGGIRIRDMVAYAKDKTELGSPANNDIKVMASYAEALKRVNEGRSFLWKVFHPIRNHAEKRDAQLIARLATENSGTRSYELAVNEANGKVSGLDRLKSETVQSVLGVKDVKDYHPENDVELSPEQLKQKEIQEWMDKYNGKGFLADINKNSEREKLPLDQLKEDPYVDNGGNEKIDEPAINQPKLEKQV